MEMPAKEQLYPLLFNPIYIEVVWGGGMLKSHLKRKLPKTKVPIGESWDISDREGAESIVSNGPLKGQSIRKLVEYYGKDLVGASFHGGRFPLLVKLIDAGKRLSLQVHPDAAAAAHFKGAEQKNEMWYLIKAIPGAKIFAGLESHCTKRQFIENINSTRIETFLQGFRSVSGDAYFINAGWVHSIGAGNLLLEIQQNSDTTYRISDWGRLGADGKPRELHVENAMECINFTDRTVPRITGVSSSADHNRKFPIINMCPYFQVDDLRLVNTWLDETDKKSFHLITSINNPVIITRDNISVEVQTGYTCLIPASFGHYAINVPEEKESTVIKSSL